MLALDQCDDFKAGETRDPDFPSPPGGGQRGRLSGERFGAGNLPRHRDFIRSTPPINSKRNDNKKAEALRKGMDDPNFLKVLEAVNMEPYYMGGTEYMDWAKKTLADEKGVVGRNNLKQ